MKIITALCVVLVLAFAAGCAAPVPTPTPSPSALPAASRAPLPGPTPTASDMPGGDAAYSVQDPDPLPWDDLPAPAGGMAFEDYPIVDGSTATRPLSQALAYYMTGITDMYELDLLASHTVTDNSYARLIYGEVDLLLVYAPAQSTLEEIEASGVELEITPIGRDALVFLVNEGNPVESLTTAQIRDIYSGAVSNWSEVGGADLPIAAFQRPERSGSQTLMRNLVMGDREMTDAPSEYRPMEMGDLVKEVSEFQNDANAIGYSVYYYVSRMYMEPGIKLISADGVAPSPQTLADASYPFLNDFYAVIRKDEPADSPARAMYEIMCGDLGRRMVEAMEYVAPLPE